MKPRPSPHALGATLYMPATHGSILNIVRGDKYPGLKSVVLCLEDAVLLSHVEDGLSNLRRIMLALQADPNPEGHPLIFVRPRSVDMAHEIASWTGAEVLDGFVAAKARPGEMARWFETIKDGGLMLMPTLETEEFFDPFAIRDFKDEMIALGSDRVLAMRIGGNDLLACLGLRRMRGMTLYDGPLGAVVGNLVCQLGSAGFALTSPVCEIFDDPTLLQAELARDVAHGLIGKTAIHPCQIHAINAAFSLDSRDYEAAARILDPAAAAVFRLYGEMCEPMTHKAWAYNISEKAIHYGFPRII